MRSGEGVVFASELKAIVAALGPELTVDPAGMVASTLYYWLPQQSTLCGRCASSPQDHGPSTDRTAPTVSADYWTLPRRPLGPQPAPQVDLAACIEVLGGCPPGRRRPRGGVPQRRPRLEHRHCARPPVGPVHRGLHDRVPRRGPAPGGHARRRALRPQAGRPPRHPTARDRDQAGCRRPAAPDGRHPRRARSATPPRSTRC